jgi:hypothetical protein
MILDKEVKCMGKEEKTNREYILGCQKEIEKIVDLMARILEVILHLEGNVMKISKIIGIKDIDPLIEENANDVKELEKLSE